MNTSTGIKKISRHMLVLLLTVTLVTGIAGLGDGVYASSSTSSPFGNTRSSYLHNSRFDGNLIVHGVDVSYFQSSSSNWDKAKKAGCDFSIMRVTYTTYGAGNLNIDSKFATHYKKAKAAGVMKGVYVFSQARSVKEARQEAQYAVNRLKALGIGPEDLELPVYMDYEFAGSSRGRNRGRLYGIKKATAINCANAFADVIRTNGYDPGVYANTNFFRSYLGNGTSLAQDIDLWDAQYYSRNESGCNYTKWQYTSTSKVNGVLYYSTNKVGSCDADFWYLNKKANKSPITTIYGNTDLKYTGKAVLPTLEIHAGNKLLKEGKDYIIGGINNVNKSKTGAYAYVKGIGKYGGYALVPITIDSGYIKHLGLSGAKAASLGNKSGSNYSIGTNSYGSYVRSVPAGTKAETLHDKLKVKSGYSIKIINAKGKEVSDSTTVKTGMMVGVYKGSTLKGTADITVKGQTINNKGANYLRKVNRSLVTVGQTSFTATASTGSTGLEIDGVGGPATVRRLQKVLGVSQTGKIRVKKSLHKYNKSLAAITYSNKKDATVVALQKWLNITADGKWGKDTSKALERRLGRPVNGKFGKGDMKALQRYLNKAK